MYTDSTYLLNEVKTLPSKMIITKQLFFSLLRKARERKQKHKMIMQAAVI